MTGPACLDDTGTGTRVHFTYSTWPSAPQQGSVLLLSGLNPRPLPKKPQGIANNMMELIAKEAPSKKKEPLPHLYTLCQ